MSREQDLLKSEMTKKIYNGGAWFSTREGNYLKIGYSESDNRLYARECVFRDGTMTGAAYTFGTDWFDISMRGRRTDIYVDPDTLKKWEIRYEPEHGTKFRSAEGEPRPPMQLMNYCKQADQEVLAGGLNAYHIDSAGFAEEMEPSEGRTGKLADILKKAEQNGSIDNLGDRNQNDRQS